MRSAIFAFGWPTLDNMIKDGTRLLMFVDRNTGNPPTLHHVVPFVWRYMRETELLGSGLPERQYAGRAVD